MSRDLLFEIGVEELPAGYVPPALEQLEAEATNLLIGLRLPTSVRTFGTPRRLTLMASVPEHQQEATVIVPGPPKKIAYDASGNPTKALEGFCRTRGISPSDVDTSGEYIIWKYVDHGKPAIEVLGPELSTLALKLRFPKRMRWLEDDTRFGRPVRWIVALLDGHVLPVRAFGVEAGRTTAGHRFLTPGPVEIGKATDYLAALEKRSVRADHRARSVDMKAQIDRLAKAAGGRVVADEELVEINNFLVEWPTAFAGAFDARYLDLPREVIVTALREHQRFFAVEKENGALLPAFIAVRNGDDRSLDVVRRGNQDVLVARLEDAKFYWDTDLKHAPAERIDSLSGVVWMEGLGSLWDKAARLSDLGGWLAERVAPGEKATVQRAAQLAKTDLLGEMIGSGKEYASLEGVMGGHYARRAGEPEAVAAAIAEHYRPRGASDEAPATMAGALLALADKLDHVAGAFVGGKIPSGSEDPYGVRRAGNGAVRILIERELRVDLRDATMESTRVFFAGDPELKQAEIVKKLGEFWRGRVEAALEDRGVSYDAREAALEARIPAGDAAGRGRPGWIDAGDSLLRAQTLASFRGDERFEPLVILFKRVANILTKATETLPSSVDRTRLAEPAEKELARALDQAREKTAPLWQRRAYAEILPALLDLEQPIHAFFDGVMVNVEDAPLRLNRLKLLAEVRELFVRGWDLSRVVVEGERAEKTANASA